MKSTWFLMKSLKPQKTKRNVLTGIQTRVTAATTKPNNTENKRLLPKLMEECPGEGDVMGSWTVLLAGSGLRLSANWSRTQISFFMYWNARSGKIQKHATFHWLLRERVSPSNLICDWLFFHPSRVPSHGHFVMCRLAVTGAWEKWLLRWIMRFF